MTDLVALSVRDFSASLASDAPAPGGGSASAAAGAMGAALLGMVCRLTLGKEKYRDAWEELERVAPAMDAQKETLLGLVDEDTRAYDAIVAARRLPKETPEEKAAPEEGDRRRDDPRDDGPDADGLLLDGGDREGARRPREGEPELRLRRLRRGPPPLLAPSRGRSRT